MPSPSSVAFTWDVCNSGGLGLLVAVRAALLFGDEGCGRPVTAGKKMQEREMNYILN